MKQMIHLVVFLYFLLLLCFFGQRLFDDAEAQVLYSVCSGKTKTNFCSFGVFLS